MTRADASPLEGARVCLVEDCTAETDGGGLCERHDHYFRVVLADEWYRNHPCPDEDAPQLPLRLEISG